MITNFEHITHEMTEDEKKLVPIMIKGFVAHGKGNPIKAPEIITKLKDRGYKITEPRLRKIVNFIRSEGILPLIGTSKGYYVSYDREVVADQIKSLEERADSIYHSAKGMRKFLNVSINEKEMQEV